MLTFDEKLKTLLKTEKSFLDEDGELLEGKLQDSARNADEKLIKLLIADEEMKSKFFSEIVGYQVFNGNLFIEYISNKNFLDNSYTKYRNKIGLQINGKFLKENGDVSLVRPFKDCVLEGGQSKEDEKKKEIFFNEILAQDEIDKLFAPKVLTNFKKYDKEGEHKVEKFNRDESGTIKDNLIIKGNNLLALHTLKREFEGKIKCIYIDVPYNTGSDSFGYNDNFNHSTWLTFMKNRLEVGKTLLNDSGIFFIQCDDNEQAYLKVLCDEIFGRENFVACIINQSANSVFGSKAAHINKTYVKVKDYILVYKKDLNIELCPLYTKSEFPIHNSHDFIYENGEKLSTVDWMKKNYSDVFEHYNLKITKNNIVKLLKIDESFYQEVFNKLLDIQYRTGGEFKQEVPEEIDTLLKQGKIQEYNGILLYRENNGKGCISFLRTLRDSCNVSDDHYQEFCKVDILGDFWNNSQGYGNIDNEGNVSLKNGKKPEDIIYKILKSATKEGDLILDYHLGSGTTCAVAHKMGRQYIGIEQLDYGKNDSVVRLQNVINGDTTGISEAVNWQGGGEFIYCELKKYNQGFIEQIEFAKTTDELLKIRELMKEKAYFKYNFDMQKFEENMDYFLNSTGSLNEQKELLVEIINKNQLYVNLSDIDDEDFAVSDEDKELNNLFYNN